MAEEFNKSERARKSPWRRAGLGTAAVVLVGALAGTSAWQSAPETPRLTTPAKAQEMQGRVPYTFADLAEQVRPAVVSIEVSGRGTPRRGPGRGRGRDGDEDFFGLPEDHPLREFFERFGERMPQRPRPSRSAGSGFLISADGFVVTNNHVVENAERIEVTMGEEQQTYDARLIGSDARTDIALLKIEGNGNFPYLEFTDTPARVGDWVLAVGNPFGLGGSVSAGIVSARGRDIGSSPYDYLQVDAAINKGNSGGPSVNLEGKVVGVNTAIFSPSGGNVGIAFSIPAGLVQQIVQDLQDDGTVDRGWLGVTIQDVDKDLAEGLGMNPNDPHGALVTNILDDGPAADSEVQVGDAIIEVQGKRVEDSRDLARKIAEIEPGTPTELTVMRDGREQSVSVELGQFPTSDRMAALQPSEPSEMRMEDLGITLAPPEGPRGEQGVRIEDVEPGSVAAEKGLRAGDVIDEVGGEPVYSPRDVRQSMRQMRGDQSEVVVLQIRRGDQRRFVALPLDQG
ncbi:Do family serine endopeptidase [Dichotomicrobium thermohalophilum]|uniref:Probable periplasmic serine endoprotease DegP-like n=1 Tax=Dichotomicrobium thermohalophilum TaxID=933063 RepID=A0A397Q212_9HYPH|nr:Do family serine endopeptidase [Dichotomicrobium thermohalophilum]RIA54973.1 serine protease Do [Dichotomicrobium thermohalophilum]